MFRLIPINIAWTYGVPLWPSFFASKMRRNVTPQQRVDTHKPLDDKKIRHTYIVPSSPYRTVSSEHCLIASAHLFGYTNRLVASLSWCVLSLSSRHFILPSLRCFSVSFRRFGVSSRRLSSSLRCIVLSFYHFFSHRHVYC